MNKVTKSWAEVEDYIRGIITRCSLSISVRTNGKYYHEIEFVLLWTTLSDYFKSVIEEERKQAETELLNGLLTHADKKIEDVNFNRHWFRLHIKTYAKENKIDLNEKTS